jgi:Predicted membrane protein (DUF2127)
MTRPAGITVLAFTMFTSGAILLVLGAFCFIMGPAIAEIVRTPGFPIFRMLGAAIVGVVLLLLGILCLLAGAGLWNVRAWGRSLSAVLVLVSVVLSVWGIALGLSFLLVRMVIVRIIVLGVDLLILWYLAQPHVKGAFGQRA